MLTPPHRCFIVGAVHIAQSLAPMAAMLDFDVTVVDPRGASKVMIALGLEREVMDLRPKYEAATKEIETLKAKLQGYEKERVAGLPSSTTRAGTTAGRVASGDATTLEEAAARAWAEIGGRPEDFR